LLESAGATAADFKLTGFGTLACAIGDEDFSYLRYIDNRGTCKADSLFGLQGEAQFSSRWSATLQAVASAPRTSDDGMEVTIRWAFISFRPNNEWLFRAGRLRPPVLINTQNAEVGVTYDQVRLPPEVYSLSPVYDVDGGAVTKTWALENAEINLDAYLGQSYTKFRFLPFQRDGAQTIFPDQYIAEKITFMGLVLSSASGPLFLRGGVHGGTLKPDGQQQFIEFTPTPFPAPPPLGGTLYVPRVVDKLDATVLTVGADWRSGDWRVTAEYAQRIIKGATLGTDSKSGYATVARSIGKWTPYVTYARLLSSSDSRTRYQDLNSTPVPLGAQGAPLFLPANFHRIVADSIVVYDQYSTMLGASYSFSATSKLKFEWMQTHIGLTSALVDGDIHNQRFNVLSVSYSMAF